MESPSHLPLTTVKNSQINLQHLENSNETTGNGSKEEFIKLSINKKLDYMFTELLSPKTKHLITTKNFNKTFGVKHKNFIVETTLKIKEVNNGSENTIITGLTIILLLIINKMIDIVHFPLFLIIKTLIICMKLQYNPIL